MVKSAASLESRVALKPSLLVCLGMLLLLALTLALLLAQATSFSVTVSRVPMLRRAYSQTSILRAGLFDSIFGPKKAAAASHILIKGANGKEFLGSLKKELEQSKSMPAAFSEAAAKYSSCPSAKKGGSLGKFTQGQMVPTFDKVVFDAENAVGSIHGPVATVFGHHLILIESRE